MRVKDTHHSARKGRLRINMTGWTRLNSITYKLWRGKTLVIWERK